MEHIEPNICNYWPANPAFDPKRMLLSRPFFNEDGTKTCLLDYTPLETNNPWWNLGAYGEAAGPRQSSSTTRMSTRSSRAWPRCATPCVVGSLSMGSRVLPFGWTWREAAGYPEYIWTLSTFHWRYQTLNISREYLTLCNRNCEIT